MRTLRTTTVLGALALTALLAACGSDNSDEASPAAGSSASSQTTGANTAVEAESLTMTDPWVKSAPKGMTAAFGTLVNSGDSDITIVSAEASGISDTVELHETVASQDGGMVMQPKEGGFVIAAGGEHELSPGGDHLMIMDLLKAVRPGETVMITLTLADGSTTEIEATVKAFTGADEKYHDGDDAGADMSHGMESDTGMSETD